MSIKSELLSLQHSDPQNTLHVADAVRWARENPTSLLHGALEWDDRVAAEAHRFSQVRQLIAVHVLNDEGAPMVVSLSIDRKAGGGYRDITDVGARPDLRQIMLADALNELERVRVKYERVQELASVWDEADRISAEVPQPAGRRRRARVAA